MTTVTAPVSAPRKRKFRRILLIAALLLGVLLTGLALYLNSDSFRETMRRRVVAELTQMTGGKVEVGSFTWTLSSVHFEARDVTIHGREAAAEIPYAHADRISVGVKIVSFFSRKISLENVTVDGFVLHL